MRGQAWFCIRYAVHGWPQSKRRIAGGKYTLKSNVEEGILSSLNMSCSKGENRESPEPEFVNLLRRDRFRAWRAGARIRKRLRSPAIDSKESISPNNVAWRTGTSIRVVVQARQAGNRILGSLKGLRISARYDNPIFLYPRFLAPIDCSKIPAQRLFSPSAQLCL